MLRLRRKRTRLCSVIYSVLFADGERRVSVQAVTAVNTFNGSDLAGRKIMVREDREDRDVKQYNRLA